MTSQFYLTLPSNSSTNDFPDNGPAAFTTMLPHSIKLAGKWEVAIVEVFFPNTLYNVLPERNNVYIERKERKENYEKYDLVDEVYAKPIEPGLYTIERLVDSINSIEEVKSCVMFSVAHTPERTKRLDVRSTGKMFSIYFSSHLTKILGLKDGLKIEGSGITGITNENVCYSDYVYIYTDIIQPQLVGDVSVPLLRIIQLNKEKYVMGSQTRVEFQNPHYVPLEKYDFSTIEIYLYDDKGKLITFAHGTSCVKLHFRKLSD